MINIIGRYTAITILVFVYSAGFAAEQDSFRWNRFRYPMKRYSQSDAIKIADNIVALQRSTGGWGKTVAPDGHYSKVKFAAMLAAEQSFELLFDRKIESGRYSHKVTTLDNDATHTQIRFLLRVVEATSNEKYKKAVLKGINYLLSAQVSTGGWTQNYPNLSSYGGLVTFNDGAMAGAMTALQEAINGEYGFISKDLAKKIQVALDRGVDFIIKSQIIVNGKKTAWCAQHNRVTYAPEGARIYELPSINGLESVAIVKVLMRISNPSIQVKDAIISAVKWFDAVKIDGIKVVKIYGEEYRKPFTLMIREDPATLDKNKFTFKGRGYDKKVVLTKGRPIWARFYDIKTQLPFFVDWDGVKVASFAEIGIERRTGYLWYGYWPENLINKNFPRWKKKWLR